MRLFLLIAGVFLSVAAAYLIGYKLTGGFVIWLFGLQPEEEFAQFLRGLLGVGAFVVTLGDVFKHVDKHYPRKRPALVTCPDCGHRVSRLAAACPQCGRPLPH